MLPFLPKKCEKRLQCKTLTVVLNSSFVAIYHACFKSGGGRVVRGCLVNFQCWGVLLIWIIEGQGPVVLAVGADGGCFGIFFSRLSLLFSFSLSLGDGPI